MSFKKGYIPWNKGIYEVCKLSNCNEKHNSHGYCNRHSIQFKNHGKILERTVFDKNELIDCGDYYEIVLYSRKNQETAKALICKDDYNKVKDYKWFLSSGGYVVTGTMGCLKLHQLILGKKSGHVIDHINRNKLDNRKINLRHCTHRQNVRNNSCKGYSWNKKYNKWQANIRIDGKLFYLGQFTKEEDAKEARREAELKYFGEFAKQLS